MQFYVFWILHIRQKMNFQQIHITPPTLYNQNYAGVVWTSFAFVPISCVRPLEMPTSRKIFWSNRFFSKNKINQVFGHVTLLTEHSIRFLKKGHVRQKTCRNTLLLFDKMLLFLFFLPSPLWWLFVRFVSRLLLTSVYRSTLNAVWSFKRMCPQRTKYNKTKLYFSTVSSRAVPYRRSRYNDRFYFFSASNRSLKCPDNFAKTPDGIA